MGAYVVQRSSGLLAPAARVPTSNALSFTSDVWIGQQGSQGQNGNGNGVCSYVPLDLALPVTITAYAVEVTTAGAGGTPTVRIGLYASDAQGWPGALIRDVGAVDATAAAIRTITGVSDALQPGRYWLAAVAQGATVSQPVLRSVSAHQGLSIPSHDATNALLTPGGLRNAGASVTTSLPASAANGGLFQAMSTPYRVAVRVANSA